MNNLDITTIIDTKNSEVEEIKSKIISWRQAKDLVSVRKLVETVAAPGIIEAIEQLETEYIIFFIKSLRQEDVAVWFNYLSPRKQEELISNLPNPDVQKVIEELYSDELIDVIEEMPPHLVKKILSLSSTETRKTVNTLLSYKNGEAGSIMNVDFIELKDSYTVKQAIKEIKGKYTNTEDYGIYYIVNSNLELVGKVALKDLFFEKKQTRKLLSIMDKNVFSVQTRDDVEEVAKIFKKYEKQAIPVINTQKKLVGIITDNDIIDVVIEETTEDINKMHGISQLKYSYLKASVWSVVKSRLLWLSILMISATLSSIVIDKFSTLGEELTIGLSTALLIPIMTVISGASGNAGSQSSVSVIRSLTIGEINSKEYKKIIWKEMKVSFIIGGILAVINMARLSTYYAIFDPSGSINLHHVGGANYSPYVLAILASLASSLALWIAIMLAKVVGGTLPLFAVKLKVDPAVMAAPILTTIIDALSTAIFFSIGIAILLVAV